MLSQDISRFAARFGVHSPRLSEYLFSKRHTVTVEKNAPAYIKRVECPPGALKYSQ